MSEVRETAVKLFGWTITSVFEPVYNDQLSPSSHVLPDSLDGDKENSSSSSTSSLRPHMMSNQSATDNSEQDNTSLQISSDLNKESKETTENSDDQHSEITTEEKTTELKKPDKILPCPRCNSEDTKFCYYNNYNVNQPRHFCRDCQRFWTAGGSMRTIPVGSGRRKNKGWVSSDHYFHITSENNSNSSSTRILSFESSEYLVADNGNFQSSEARIKTDSVSEEFNNFHRYLLPQVTTPVSPSWPYQYPLNPSFYHMPVYWGCTVPFLSTFETSKFLGKRTRDEASHETVRETKDAFVRARLVSESQSINNEASIATKTEQFNLFVNGSETKSTNRFVTENSLNLQANPAAMARSMNFRESM